MIKYSKGTKFFLAVLTIFVGVLLVWFANGAEGAPVIQLTSPHRATVVVPEGMGLLIEVEISDDSLPDSPDNSWVSWSVLEAPDGGTVTFSPPHGPAAVATFNLPGFYRILISATNDGLNAATKELAVYAGILPNKNPGPLDAIVHLAMDEGAGFTARDSRGKDNNGRPINGASWTGPDGGISGTGIVLDGIDDEIQIRDYGGSGHFLTHERSLSLWFKADDPHRVTKQVLYREGDRSGDWSAGLTIYLKAGRLYVGGWLSGNFARQETFFSTELVDTNWHHVALVLSESQGISFDPKAFRGYLDGFEFGRGDGDILILQGFSYGDRQFTLGANRGSTRFPDGFDKGPGAHFAGIVDEFQLWNRELTSREIRQLVGQHIGKTRFLGPELALSSVDHSPGSVVIPPGMGIVLDGNIKGNSSLETKWETAVAPEGSQATFENSSQPSTFATFSTPGYYKLRLSADNGLQKSAIDVDVHAGLDAGSNFPSSRELVYYPMDEGSGVTVGNNADGSRPGLLSNPSGWTSEGGGISGTAVQFDGKEDYLELGNQFPPAKSSHAKSFALWMKPNEIGTGKKEVIFQKAGPYGGLYIYLDGNVLYFGGRNYTEIRWNTYMPVPITRGRWHHVALVFDPDSSGFHHDGLRAYLNGRQVASGLVESGIDSRMDQGTLGRQLDGSHFHDGFSRRSAINAFSGIVDEFHYYQDHALTIDEIGMLYAFGNVGPTVYAGPDQLVVPPSSTVRLEGSSTDDGRWSSPVTHSWHILDGPEDGNYRLLENNGSSAEFGPLIPGSYRIALGAYDSQVTTFDELLVTVRHPTQFELFMRNYPAIAVEDRSYHADPDRDNWSNLVEYALGGTPDMGETYYQLGLQHELVMEAGYLYAEFRYPRRRDAAERGLRYEFEVSDDFSAGSWTRRGFYVLEVIPIDEIFEEVRLTIADPIDSANPRIFGRVRVVIDE